MLKCWRARVQISQTSSWFSFPFLLVFLVFSHSPSHKGAHCSWQNFNLVEIESRCGSAFSSQGGAGLLPPWHVSFCGACWSCLTSMSHVIQCFGWFWRSSSFFLFFMCVCVLGVTHSLPLLTSSISQVEGWHQKTIHLFQTPTQFLSHIMYLKNWRAFTKFYCSVQKVARRKKPTWSQLD